MAEEYIDIVNGKDEVVGKDLKSSKKIKNFISRTASVLICNSRGQFLTCKRGPHKKNDPNVYDVSAYGNVMAGENCEQAAKREMLEEVGIDCGLTFLDKYYHEIDNNGEKTAKVFCYIFLGRSDQEPKLNHELVGFKRLTLKELEKEFINKPTDYCDGFKEDIATVRDKLFKI